MRQMLSQEEAHGAQEGDHMTDYQEGFRDGVRSVFMWCLSQQFNIEFPTELIQYLGESMKRENEIVDQQQREDDT